MLEKEKREGKGSAIARKKKKTVYYLPSERAAGPSAPREVQIPEQKRNLLKGVEAIEKEESTPTKARTPSAGTQKRRKKKPDTVNEKKRGTS